MFSNLRFAFRTLAKRPGFTMLVVLVLGLGLGSVTALVDLVNLLAWRPLPVEKPDEVVRVFTANHGGFVGPYGGTSYLDYVDYRDRSEAFAGLAAESESNLRLGQGDSTEYALATSVSGNFFDVLGLRPSQGRGLTPEDDVPGAAPVLVLSDHQWRKLGSDPKIVGSSLTVEGQPFTVVGVGPAGFNSINAGAISGFFIPLAALPRVEPARGSRVLEDRKAAMLGIVGRLNADATPASAQADLQRIAAVLDEKTPLSVDQSRRITAQTATISHPVDLDRISPTLKLFGVAVALLLFITCANVAHLLLARAEARRREMGIRQAIGAGRGALLRQLLTENLLLALGGGAAGLVLAYWARAFFVNFASPEFAAEMRFDIRVLGASFLACLAATLLFGLLPALATSRINLVSSLKAGEGEDGRRRFNPGALLSAGQVALSVVLLVSGALLFESLRHRLNADRGFDDDRLAILNLTLPESDYGPEQGRAFWRELIARAEALPEVERAGTSLIVPPLLFDIQVPHRLPEDPENERSTRINYADRGYFDVMGIPLHQGRFFNNGDAASDQGVVIVNRALAEASWPGEDPIGRTILVNGRPNDPGPEHTVVGVVGNIDQHSSSFGGEAILYFAPSQRYRPLMKLVVRASGDPVAALPAMRDLLREMNPALAPNFLSTGEKNHRQAFVFEEMQAQAVGLFAVFGLMLAVLGIFGVLSYAVSRRTREIGIRMALGARRQDVLAQIVTRGLRVAGFGILVGLGGTFAARPLLDNLLFGVSAGNVGVLAMVVLVVTGAALAAAYLPARRASLLDPLKALRHD